MKEAPSRLPSRHLKPEAFLRYFQPATATRFYAGVDLHARSLYLAVLAVGRDPRLPPIAKPGRCGADSATCCCPLGAEAQESLIVPGKGKYCLLTSRALCGFGAILPARARLVVISSR
jgi:hypothetical protein